MTGIDQYYLFWGGLITLTVLILAFMGFSLRSYSGVRKKGIAALVLAFSIGAFGLYYHLGDHRGLLEKYTGEEVEKSIAKLNETTDLTEDAALKEIEDLSQKLPNSERKWAQLAQIYQTLRQYELASEAYQKALQMNPEVEHYQMQLAYCKVMLREGKVDPDVMTLLHQVRTKSPHHKGALNLLALEAYQQKNYQQAIQYWQDILSHAKDLEDNEKQAILTAIDKTTKQLKDKAEISKSYSS